jgi:hypothetical protein
MVVQVTALGHLLEEGEQQGRIFANRCQVSRSAVLCRFGVGEGAEDETQNQNGMSSLPAHRRASLGEGALYRVGWRPESGGVTDFKGKSRREWKFQAAETSQAAAGSFDCVRLAPHFAQDDNSGEEDNSVEEDDSGEVGRRRLLRDAARLLNCDKISTGEICGLVGKCSQEHRGKSHERRQRRGDL